MQWRIFGAEVTIRRHIDIRCDDLFLRTQGMIGALHLGAF